MTESRMPRGVHRIEMPIPFPLQTVHVYVVETSRGFVLVDSGFPSEECRSIMDRELRRVCGSVANVVAVIVTHFHPDHSGLAGWVQGESGAEVYVHGKDWEMVALMLSAAEPGPEVFAPDLFAQSGVDLGRMWGEMRSRVNRVRYPVERVVKASGGESLDFGDRRLRLVWTPGHTAGHVCVLDAEEGVLFSGDHLLGRITPHIGLFGNSSENPLLEYERSLKLVQEMAPKLALPAHEMTVEDPARRAGEIREHHQVRRRAVLAAIDDEAETAKEISEKVFAGRTDPMQRFLALSETMAHLEALIEEGAVERYEGGGEERFRGTG